jgi:hypothetical protein
MTKWITKENIPSNHTWIQCYLISSIIMNIKMNQQACGANERNITLKFRRHSETVKNSSDLY